MTNGIKSVVLAALALSVLLVQPICDAHELLEVLPAAWRAAARNTAATAPPDQPPASHPYHIRSARILS